MDIKSDTIHIGSNPNLEPEEQVAQRVTNIDVTIKGDKDGQVLGQLKHGGAVVASYAATTVANQFSRMCGLCKHFRLEQGQKLLKQWCNSPQGQKRVVAMGEDLIERGYVRMESIDRLTNFGFSFDSVPIQEILRQNLGEAINGCGICTKLTELNNQEAFMPANSVCPQELRSADKPLGLFEPADADSVKKSTTNYDSIMMRAAGKNV